MYDAIMEYQKYHDTAHEASRLFETGNADRAIALFLDLLQSDISDLDKSIVCRNIAVILEKSGKTDEVMDWYDQGVALEEPHLRHVIAEYRAAHMATLGRRAESLAAYERILQAPSLTESEKARITQNIALLRQQVATS